MEDTEKTKMTSEDAFKFLSSTEVLSTFLGTVTGDVTQWNLLSRVKVLVNAAFPSNSNPPGSIGSVRTVGGHTITAYAPTVEDGENSDMLRAVVYKIDDACYKIKMHTSIESSETLVTCESGQFEAVSYLVKEFSNVYMEDNFISKFADDFPTLFQEEALEDVFRGSEYRVVIGDKSVVDGKATFSVLIASPGEFFNLYCVNSRMEVFSINKVDVSIESDYEFVSDDQDLHELTIRYTEPGKGYYSVDIIEVGKTEIPV